MSSELLAAAQAAHRRGALDEAIAGYARILEAEPGRGDVWHLRSLAEHQGGRFEASWVSITRALEIAGEEAPMLLLAGMVATDRRDLSLAEQLFARAAKARPGWAAPLANRGRVLMDLGDAEGALEALRAAAALDASNARVWNNIGLALQSLERMDEAERAFNHALTLAPLATAHFNIARLRNTRNDVKGAFDAAQAAVRADPMLTDAHLLLGDLHRKMRDAGGMRSAFAAAVKSSPSNVRALNAQAEFLASVGEAREAREQYRRIERAHPDDLKAALGAHLTLPQVYRDAAEAAQWRAEFSEGLARLEAARDRYVFATPRDAMLAARWSNFYLAYQGGDDRELQSRYGDFISYVLGRAFPEAAGAPAPRPARERLRVGFCSHFFFNCTAGRYFAPWITRLARERFETFVYYTNEWVADDTREIAAAASTFHHLPGRSFDSVARRILADELDVLVFPELGMHGETFTLAALRLAPVQVAGWGHPVTTGLPHVDRFVSCAPMERPGADDDYREKLALLPGLGTHYAKPEVAASGERAKFGLPEDANLYLVPQSLFKIHPDNDELFAATMAADPRGVLVFFAAHYDAINANFQDRLARALAGAGVEPSSRAIFLPYMTHAEYLEVNACCDVMLDTLHWSGGNTSLDAIASGLPVVTLPGRFMRGRQSAAMLSLTGVPELVAADAAGFVSLAASIATDRALRGDLSRRMREGHGALFGRDEPIRALENLLSDAAKRG